MRTTLTFPDFSPHVGNMPSTPFVALTVPDEGSADNIADNSQKGTGEF